MAEVHISGVSLRGIVSVVPKNEVALADEWEAMGGETAQLGRLKATIGLDRRRVVPDGMTALDLARAAGERLIAASSVDRSEIDGILMVTQTPDYWQPGNAILLQERLGLSTNCTALDINLGCSGYVYGLWVAHSLLVAGGLRRILLFAGDTISRIVGTRDRSLRPLFGDAASATLLEPCSKGQAWFDLCSDGSGAQSLWQPGGAFREPLCDRADEPKESAPGVVRRRRDLHMEGADIFNFSLKVEPASIQRVLSACDWDPESVDGYILHQANRYILENIRRRLGVPAEKLPSAIVERFGNQSSASVPFTLCEAFGNKLCSKEHRLILSGFGVGLSWATAAIQTPALRVCEWFEL